MNSCHMWARLALGPRGFDGSIVGDIRGRCCRSSDDTASTLWAGPGGDVSRVAGEAACP